MLNRTNMVGANVEAPTSKSQAVNPFHRETAGCFHNKMSSSIINCLGHHLKDQYFQELLEQRKSYRQVVFMVDNISWTIFLI